MMQRDERESRKRARRGVIGWDATKPWSKIAWNSITVKDYYSVVSFE